MSEPITVSNEDAAVALAHKHPKSKPPATAAFPGFGGGAPGANGPPTTGASGPPSVSPAQGGPAYSDDEN